MGSDGSSVLISCINVWSILPHNKRFSSANREGLAGIRTQVHRSLWLRSIGSKGNVANFYAIPWLHISTDAPANRCIWIQWAIFINHPRSCTILPIRHIHWQLWKRSIWSEAIGTDLFAVGLYGKSYDRICESIISARNQYDYSIESCTTMRQVSSYSFLFVFGGKSAHSLHILINIDFNALPCDYVRFIAFYW